MDDRAESRLQIAQQVRPAVVLAVAWKLLAELYRRHHAMHDLRLLRSHPGSSMAGRMVLYTDLRGEDLDKCTRLTLNLGGPTGTFKVTRLGQTVAEGDFLWPALMGDPATVVVHIESLLRLEQPAALPPSSPAVVAMRVMAEILTASLMDRQELRLQPAWFDWSGGSQVYPWASHFGVDAAGLQKRLDVGGSSWEAIYLSVADFFRLCFESEAGVSCDTAALFDLKTGTLLVTKGEKVFKKVDLVDAFIKAGRRIEPIAADLLSTLRRGK